MASSGISALSQRLAEIQTMVESLSPAARPAPVRPTSTEGAGRSTGSEFAALLEGLSLDGATGPEGSVGERVVELALSKLGTPYVYGAGRGANPTNFDCSGLTYWAYGQLGVKIGTWTGTQQHDGTRIADYHADGAPLTRGEVTAVARPGDLVFMKGGDGSYASGYPGHVGIYIGNGQMVHAPKTGDVVKVSDLSERSDMMYVQRITEPARADSAAPPGTVGALLTRLAAAPTGPAAGSRHSLPRYATSGFTTPNPALTTTPGGRW